VSRNRILARSRPIGYVWGTSRGATRNGAGAGLDRLLAHPEAHASLEDDEGLMSPRKYEMRARAAAVEETRRRIVEATLALPAERGAAELENVRRERHHPELRMLQEAHARIEAALDGLVAEALRPLGAAPAESTMVRALTELAVWRSLRERGIAGAAAVDTVASLACQR
jgi:hypothetical protein